MLELDIYNKDGSIASKMELNETVFAVTPNRDVVHRAVQSELTNSRQGTHASKNRSKVRGGGKKPFKQKGRGVARAGTNRSPLWKGGGTVFGPEPHEYSFKLPKKMKRLARRSVLTNKVETNSLIIIDELTLSNVRTKEFVSILNELKISNKKVTVLLGKSSEKVFLSARNIRNVAILEAKDVSTYDLIDCEVLLVEKSGMDILTKQLMVK